jgi:hypothetical protein
MIIAEFGKHYVGEGRPTPGWLMGLCEAQVLSNTLAAAGAGWQEPLMC